MAYTTEAKVKAVIGLDEYQSTATKITTFIWSYP